MVYDEFHRIDQGAWKWDQPEEFDFEATDTASLNNIIISLRHTTEYPLSNLYMYVHVTGPSGQQMFDTINFYLAKPSGEWLGKGISKTREIGYLYKKNTRFPEPGMYRVSIEQAMRLPEVPVTELGVRVEKTNP